MPSKFIGAKAHAARLKYLGSPAVDLLVGKALYVAGQSVQVEAQISLTTGAVSGKNHQPSAAGSPPNQDTGVLGNNIETVQRGPLLVEVSSNAPYAAAQEYGRETPTRLPERPYMRPARDKQKPYTEQLVRKALAQAVRQSKRTG